MACAFSYERVLKLMAALGHLQQRAVGLSRYLLVRATYWLLGILWMTAATIVFMGLSLIYFPPSRFIAPATAYLFSFVCAIALRAPGFNRRLRRLGIAPEQRARRAESSNGGRR